MHYFCSKDCPDTCSFDISFAADGHPVFKADRRPYTPQPFVCAKLRGFFDVESSETPISFFREAGRKRETGTEEAIDKAAAMIRRHQRGRILFMRGSGSLSWRMSAWDTLFSQIKSVWFVDGSPCDETGITAHNKDFSVCVNPPVERLETADAIILFGKNARVTSPHLYVYLSTLLKKGHRIVSIDPVQTETSRLADRYVRISPAGDGALSAAILARLNLAPGLNWTHLREISGVSPEDFEYLVALFAQKKRTALITGYGLQRYSNGMNTVRWIDRLAVLTGNEDLLFYGKSSKEGFESPEVSPSGSVPIAELSKKLSGNFFDLVVVVGANPCVTYPESAVWMDALSKTPLIAVDVRETETTAHADLFLRVSGMFGQEDVQGSYFFKEEVKIRSEGLLHHHPDDADTASRLAAKLGIPLSVKRAAEIRKTDGMPKRQYACDGLDVLPPMNLPGYRLLTVSHPLFLNSQIPPEIVNRDASLFISREVAAAEKFMNGEVLRVKNQTGFFEAPCRVTSALKGPVVMAYKNRPFLQNWPNYVVGSRATDAGSGLDYYDTFVALEKL